MTERYTDPFGNTYTDSTTRTTRPLAVAGLAGAGAIWLGAAWEAVAYASRSRSRAEAIIAQRESGGAALAVKALPRGRVGMGMRLGAAESGAARAPARRDDARDETRAAARSLGFRAFAGGNAKRPAIREDAGRLVYWKSSEMRYEVATTRAIFVPSA